VSQPHVVVYTKDFCSSCLRAKNLLRGKGVDFEEIDVSEQDELREQLIARTGRRTVPQIFINDRHIGGFDDLYALNAAGGLDPLLAGDERQTG
jgi:GrxC family glutaredoxin